MKTISTRSAATLAAVLAIAMTPAASAAADGPLLPDLRQAPVGCPGGYGGNPARCNDWDVCMVRDASAPNGRCVNGGTVQAVRLRFTTSEDNIGDGPLLLFGQRDSTDRPTMEVRQAFQTGVDGPIPDSFQAAQRPTANSTYYEPAKMHQHWHLMGFEHFELRAPGGGVVAADRKNGFCLGDRYHTADADTLPHAVRNDNTPQGLLGQGLAGNMCSMHNPDALKVVEGISVGRGDDYTYDVDFQWLDITSVPSGTYDVVNTVNADHTLLESNYENNSSSIAISVQWPHGAHTPPTTITQPPRVKLLRSCPGQTHCATPPAP
ncbi:lysyl oxidase family protein [Amycolatopsis sp. H20-H5]|uniref:lysyl oxidase family protein n=1 Tax=Amycolatopsis sp. H20-H5 TaxID=3046309 RepID=UPI002DB9360D|nr:lysyl oxidase family protein [Amycolatopsis sp. H20-H5]MEC3976576.1 lysyl oxidase family protein [Amycolatopsis sp. H20-H5]